MLFPVAIVWHELDADRSYEYFDRMGFYRCVRFADYQLINGISHGLLVVDSCEVVGFNCT